MTCLQLGQGEATAGADAAVVFDRGAADDGSELVNGAGSDSGGLGHASIAAPLLAAGLLCSSVRQKLGRPR